MKLQFISVHTLKILVFCVIGSCTEKEEVRPVVSAGFSANETASEESSTIIFTDQTTGEPTGWEWTFEGGQPGTSTEQHPTVSYPNSGTFDVLLKVTNGYNEDTESKDDFITIYTTVAGAFSANNRVVAIDTPVIFEDESEGGPTSWTWNFEGAEPASSTEENPTVRYSEAGVYDVVLKVSNTHTDNTITEIGFIRVYEPVAADFGMDATSILQGEQIAFSDESSGNPTQWYWTFEGGTPSTSTDKNPVILYDHPGEFNVTLLASHSDNEDEEVKEAVVLVEAKETDNPGGSEYSGPIYDVVENIPTPEGGMSGWNEYLTKNLRYPQEAIEKEIEGTVTVEFIVETDGNLTSLEILRGIGGGCDEEALRLVRESSKWNPGVQRGDPVRVRMRMPIRFSLS